MSTDKNPERLPLLLRIGMPLSFVAGSMLVLSSIAAALGWADTSSLAHSSLGVWAAPLWGFANWIAGLLLLAIAIGLKLRRPWARPLMVCFWTALAVGELISVASIHSRVTTDLTAILALAIAVWYLYAKRSSVQFFNEIKLHRQA